MKWLTKLRSGLSKTSTKLGGEISAIFKGKTLDDAAIEELTDTLILSDMGVDVATQLVNTLQQKIHKSETTDEEIKAVLAQEVSEILTPYAHPLDVDATHSPHVVVMVGVNGSGKTTTIGKLAADYKQKGMSVRLAACDTFRAAAVQQLQDWGSRVGVEVVTGNEGQDPASVAYEALEKAKTDGIDLLFIDTAGRLQNNKDLMDALSKLNRVIQKIEPDCPHDVVLVLDGTVGQNAHKQVEAFREVAGVTGLVITKLDGTSKAGVVVALAKEYELPIHAIGVGESAEDLQAFDATEFANALIGVSESESETVPDESL